MRHEKKGTSTWSLHLIVLLLVSSLDMWVQPYPLSSVVPIPSGEAFHPYVCLSKIKQVYALTHPVAYTLMFHLHLPLLPTPGTSLDSAERRGSKQCFTTPALNWGTAASSLNTVPMCQPTKAGYIRGLSDFLVLFHHSCRGSWLQNMKKISNVSK